MKKRILAASAAVGVVLGMMAPAHADDRFVFRPRPGVINVAAQEPTLPEYPVADLVVSVSEIELQDFGSQPGVLDTGDSIQVGFLVETNGEASISDLTVSVDFGAFGKATAQCSNGGDMAICQAQISTTLNGMGYPSALPMTEEAIQSFAAGTAISHSITGSVVGITLGGYDPATDYTEYKSKGFTFGEGERSAVATVAFTTPSEESKLVFRFQGGISIACKTEWTQETVDTYSAGLVNATTDLMVNTLSGGRVHVTTGGSILFNSSLTPSDPVSWPTTFRSVYQVVPEGEFGAGVDHVDPIASEKGSFNYIRSNNSVAMPIPSSVGRPCIDHPELIAPIPVPDGGAFFPSVSVSVVEQ